MHEADEPAMAGDATASGPRGTTWICCAMILTVSAVLTWWPQGLETWRYDRDAVAAGEYWRLMTGHLVHVGAAHYAMNLLGLVLVTELLWNGLQARHGMALLILSAVVIDLAMLHQYPEVAWYAGLSGVLHALWAGCALIGLRPATRFGQQNHVFAFGNFSEHLVNTTALVLLCGKIWIEYQTGPVGDAILPVGAPVIYAAHWYGAMAGAGYALIVLCLAGWKQRI